MKIKINFFILGVSAICLAQGSSVPNVSDDGSGVQHQGNLAVQANVNGIAFGQNGVSLAGDYLQANNINPNCCDLYTDPPQGCIANCPEAARIAHDAIEAGQGLIIDHTQQCHSAVNTVNSVTMNQGQFSANQCNGTDLPTYPAYQQTINNFAGSGILINPATGTILSKKGVQNNRKNDEDPKKANQQTDGNAKFQAIKHSVQTLLEKAKSLAEALMKNYWAEKFGDQGSQTSHMRQDQNKIKNNLSSDQLVAHSTRKNEKSKSLKGEGAGLNPSNINAGLRLIYGDDFVGVRGDNIFQMVRRQYRREIEKNSLLLHKK